MTSVPAVHELAGREEPRTLVVVLDRAHARVFAVTAGSVREIADVASPATRGGRFHSDRHGAPGGGEHSYHTRIEEESRRHFKAVIDVLGAELIGRPDDHLLLAGPGPMATVFRHHLSVPLSARVIGVEQMNPLDVTPAIVAGAAREAASRHHRQAEEAVMAAVLEGLGTGLATNGVRETLRALAHRQVRVLITHPHARGVGYRCLHSGRLVLSPADCRGEGAREVADIIRAAVREATHQGANVVIMRDPAVARQIDDLAALLRFTETDNLEAP